MQSIYHWPFNWFSARNPRTSTRADDFRIKECQWAKRPSSTGTCLGSGGHCHPFRLLDLDKQQLLQLSCWFQLSDPSPLHLHSMLYEPLLLRLNGSPQNHCSTLTSERDKADDDMMPEEESVQFSRIWSCLRLEYFRHDIVSNVSVINNQCQWSITTFTFFFTNFKSLFHMQEIKYIWSLSWKNWGIKWVTSHKLAYFSLI